MAPMSRKRRAQERAKERALRKLVRDTEALAGRLPGGSPERPIDVASASVVEGKARATPCVQCGGELDLRADRATSTPRGVLREVALACRRCHAPRVLWFRIVTRAAN
jgi:hypothetical protein